MPFFASMEGSLGYGRGIQYISSNGLGLSSNNPGINATQIYNAGNTSNGWYWVKTSMMGASRQVWCNMIDAGGGWMLVSYNGNKQSTNAVAAGQFYPVAWSNGQGTLSGQFAANAMDLWFHNGTNQCSNLMRLASASANAVPTVANSYIGHYVTYIANASTLNLSTGSGVQGTGVFATSGQLMDARWSSLKGYTSLSTIYTKADADWMYNTGANFYWNPILPASQSTSRSGNALDTGGWMRTQGKDSWGLSNVAYGVNSGGAAFIGSTLAVFIK